MSGSETESNKGPEMTTITLKIPQSFLEDLDATWRAEDFPSRSEFIRWVLRDAMENPSFSRSAWKDIARSEHQRRTGEGRTYSAAEVREMLTDAERDDG